MKKALSLILIVGLILSMTSCAGAPTQDDSTNNSEPGSNRSSTNTSKAITSDSELLNGYLKLIKPITDRTIANQLFNGGFSSFVTSWCSKKDNDYKVQAKSKCAEITSVFDTIIGTEVLSGYALEDSWSLLQTKCRIMKSKLEKVIASMDDNNYTTTLSNLNDCSNTSELLETAITCNNQIAKALKKANTNEITTKFNSDEAQVKASLYAKKYYNNSDVKLTQKSELYVFDTVGKYYEFTALSKKDNVSFLVDVQNGGLVLKEGNSHTSISDAELPPQEGDDVMPDLVGLSKSEAIKTIEKKGYKYEIGYCVDDKKIGTVVSTNPSAGETLQPGTSIVLLIGM